MEAIRRLVSFVVVALALSVPTLASAEQLPSELCGGDKQAGKDPTAEKSESAKDASKPQEKPKDSSEEKPKDGEVIKS